MNKIGQIVGNAIDMCGGALVEKLPENAAVLYVLNALADMDLELLGSNNARAANFKVNFNFCAQSGTLPANVVSRPEYIRFRAHHCGRGNWRVLEICGDIEDLTSDENTGRQSVLISGSTAPFSYQLSFAPDGNAIFAELWGKTAKPETGNLSNAPRFAAEHAHKAATDAALLLLDDCLLLPGAERLERFVNARKMSLLTRKRSLDYWWTVYCADAPDAIADSVMLDYDPFAAGEPGNY